MTEVTRQQAPPSRDIAPGGGTRVAWHSQDRWRGALLAGGSALVALVSFGYRLGVPPLWRDEATTKDMSGRSVRQILATLPHYDAVHGAYYLFMHFAEKLPGNSNAGLRLPSLLAMAAACAFTALAARRLAAAGGIPRPWFTAGTAGLVFALLPGAVRYAQEARSYAIVTLCAAIATYLLTRAAETGGRWWAAYAVTVAVGGVVNVFSLLILPAHGLSLASSRAGGPLVLRRRPDGHGRHRAARLTVRLPPAGWLAGAAAALAAAVPVLILAYHQRAALTWKSVPSVGPTVAALLRFWTGSWGLTVLACALAAVGVAASARAARQARGAAAREHPSGGHSPGGTGGRPPARQLSLAGVAVPLLTLPAAVLLGVSQAVPVYDNRYIEFCLPAFAMLVGRGLGGLWAVGAALQPRRALAGWLPAAAAAAAVIAMAVPGDALVRQPGARGDNLEFAAHVIADNARPGDIVLYVPISYRTVSLPFPAPWRGLRDIALRKPPAASDTLYGTDVSPAVLRARFRRFTRVWFVTPPPADYAVDVKRNAFDATEARLVAGLYLVHRWVDHDVIITLYSRYPRTGKS